MMRNNIYLLLLLFIFSCKEKENPDLINENLITSFDLFESSEAEQLYSFEMTCSEAGQLTVHNFTSDEIVFQENGNSFNGNLNFPVYGIDNQFNFEFISSINESAQQIDTTLTIKAAPSYLPQINIITPSTQNQKIAVSFNKAFNENYNGRPFVFDQSGNIRFHIDKTFLDGSTTKPFEIIPANEGKNNFITVKFNAVYIISKDYAVEKVIETAPFTLHHDAIILPDGTLLLAAQDPSLDTDQDQIIQVDTTSGSIVKHWDLRTVIEPGRTVISGSPNDWLHVNSIWYDESSHSITVSGRHQGVFNIDFEDGALNWIIASHAGWDAAYEDYLLTAIDEEGNAYENNVQNGQISAESFDWPWTQHAAMLNEAGNVLVFDNGFYRNYQYGNSYSRAVEYEIDTVDMTIKQKWQYGKERGLSFASDIVGDVDVLDNGDRLIFSGLIWEDVPKAELVIIDQSSGYVKFQAELIYSNQNVGGNFIWGDFDFASRAEILP